MSLVVVGSVATDNIETPKGKVEYGLGGSATHFSLASSYFTTPKIVGVIGDDFPEKHIEMLKNHKIETEGIKRVAGKTFHWEGIYGENFGDPETLLTELGVFADFQPEIPESYMDSKVLFLANIDPVLQLEVVEKMPDIEFIGADTMNFWINGKRDDLLKLLKRVDLLVINELEVKLLSGTDHFFDGARAVQEMGPKILIIKKGKHGAAMLAGDKYFEIPAYPLEGITDPTGAGDSFAGGMMGYLTATGKYDFETIKKAMVYGTITASIGVQKFCTEGLENSTREEIDSLLEKYRDMTQWK